MRNPERPYRDLPEVQATDHLIRRLTTARIRQGLSQRGLAKRMGTTQSAVSDFERHLVDPRVSTFERVAEALGCSIIVRLTDLSGEGPEEVLPLTARAYPYRPTVARIDRSHMQPVQQAPANRLGGPWYIPELDELVAYARMVSPVDVRHPFIRPIRVNDTPDPFLAGVRA